MPDKDKKRWLRLARSQGLKPAPDLTNGSHVGVRNVATGATQRVGTNKSGGTYHLVKDLMEAGFEPPVSKKEARSQRNRQRAAHGPDPTKKDTPMRKTTQDVINEILEDVPYAAGLLMEALRDAAEKSGGKRSVRNDRPGREWRGDILSLARSLWTELPNDSSDSELIELQIKIVQRLINDGDIIVGAVPIGAEGEPTWWVADDLAASDTSPQTGSAPENNGRMEDVHEPVPFAPVETPPSGGGKPDTDQTHPQESVPLRVETCPYCPYTHTHGAVSTHVARTKMANGTHPVERVIACKDYGPDPDCPVVVTSSATFRNHMGQAHGMQGWFIASNCLRMFSTRGAQARHLARHRNNEFPNDDCRAPGAVAEEAKDEVASIAASTRPEESPDAVDSVTAAPPEAREAIVEEPAPLQVPQPEAQAQEASIADERPVASAPSPDPEGGTVTDELDLTDVEAAVRILVTGAVGKQERRIAVLEAENEKLKAALTEERRAMAEERRATRAARRLMADPDIRSLFSNAGAEE